MQTKELLIHVLLWLLDNLVRMATSKNNCACIATNCACIAKTFLSRVWIKRMPPSNIPSFNSAGLITNQVVECQRQTSQQCSECVC